MPKMQSVHRQAAGLQSQFNPFSLPDGALLEASNCVIDREGLIEKRRGWNRYGSEFADTIEQLIEYRDRAIAYSGGAFYYDADGAGAWSAWSGSWAQPDATTRIRGVEARSNLYLTTSKGPVKVDSLSGTPRRAGMPQGLDIEIGLLGSGAWFLPDTQVGYRIVWTREDANGMLVAGAPSFREVATNPNASVTIDWDAGIATVAHTAHGYVSDQLAIISNATDAVYNGTHEIQVIDADNYYFELPTTPSDDEDITAKSGRAREAGLVFTVPQSVIAGDRYEIYRTEMSASAGTDPGDRHFLIISKAITTSELAARTVSFQDIYDESYLGIELVTNPTQETITQANDRPPWAKDMALYKGHLFYLNTRVPHYLEIQLLSLTALTAGVSTITIAGRVYTFATSEDIAGRRAKIFSSEVAVSLGIEKTAKSLIRVINRDPASAAHTAYYVSGVDDPPGKILIRMREVDSAQFSVLADSTATGDAFAPAVPTTATLLSDNDASGNRLYRSKFEQPEAVPAANFDDVGTESADGLRILPLRDSLIILKEDGVWRLSGDSELSFFIAPLDRSVKVVAPETAVVLDNSVYCLSNQGVVRINENGTAIVSRPIETDILRVFALPSYRTLSHAVSYETDRKYILFTPQTASDTTATKAWVYNYLTGAWTTWSRGARAAVVLFEADRFYAAHTSDRYVLRERKGYAVTAEDFSDEDIAVTISAVGSTSASGRLASTATVTYSYSGYTLAAGALLSQGSLVLRATAVTSLGGTSYLLTLDEYASALATGSASISLPIAARVLWAPDTAGDPASLKHFKEAQIQFESDVVTNHRMGFASDLSPYEETVEAILESSRGWGLTPWGEGAWGDDGPGGGLVLRSFVPRQKARARALSISYESRFARETFAIAQMTTVFRTIGEKSTRAPR